MKICPQRSREASGTDRVALQRVDDGLPSRGPSPQVGPLDAGERAWSGPTHTWV
jgi:hypothetical protein